MNRRLLLAQIMGLAALPRMALGAPTADSIVNAVDRLRSVGNSGFRSRLQITEVGASRQGVYNFSSILGGDLGTLVTALDSDQKGQSFLANPSGFWVYVPRTRRAIRLTALQAVRGQASLGDLSRLKFADDYTAAFNAQPSQVIEGRECWVLDLKARSPKSTYAKVLLAAEKSTGFPVRAELFSTSNRKLKTAVYSPPSMVSGRQLIATTRYVDALRKNTSTTVKTLTVEPYPVRAAMFRPEALGVAK